MVETDGPNEAQALANFSAAVTEYEQAVDALNRLADARGQGDRSLPLVVRPSDTELVAAVHRELTAREASSAALATLAAVRGVFLPPVE
jgi:alpha-D-ribose 1-methylphosphonate 5-triphosphate synthase subunit PhnI